MIITKLDLGQYSVKEDNFIFLYVIHKIHPKTVDVSIIDYYRPPMSTITSRAVKRHYRYNKIDLLAQININKNAIFSPPNQ